MKKTIICYTDGSAIDNGRNGTTGYGSHMYIVDEDTRPKKIKNFTVTDDGYIESNIFKLNKDTTKKEVGISKIVDIYGYDRRGTTNNTAEINGVYYTLETILNPVMEDILGDVEKIILKIDSQYVLLGLEKVMSDNTNSIVANNELFVEIEILYKKILEKGIELVPTKVKGHSGDLGNDRADLLANLGRVCNSRNGLEINVVIKDRKDYWDDKIILDPLMDSTKLIDYTNSLKNMHEFTMLNLVNYKDDEIIGSAKNDIRYVSLYGSMNKYEINLISKLMAELTDTLKTIYTINLKSVYDKNVFRNIELYGTDYLEVDKRVMSRIVTIDGVTVASEIYPISVAYKSMEINKRLNQILEDFVKNEIEKGMIKIDITDELFEKNDKGKVILKKDILNDKYKFTLDVSKYVSYKKKLKLQLGLDTLKRNNFKKLENRDIKVYLLLETHNAYFKYRTVVTTKDENDKTIAALIDNHYCNTIYLIK